MCVLGSIGPSTREYQSVKRLPTIGRVATQATEPLSQSHGLSTVFVYGIHEAYNYGVKALIVITWLRSLVLCKSEVVYSGCVRADSLSLRIRTRG